MIYSDYPLVFPDEETFSGVWTWRDDDGVAVLPDGMVGALPDVIGLVEGRTGFMVNLRVVGAMPEALQPYLIDAPEHPVRKWA